MSGAVPLLVLSKVSEKEEQFDARSALRKTVLRNVLHERLGRGYLGKVMRLRPSMVCRFIHRNLLLFLELRQGSAIGNNYEHDEKAIGNKDKASN